MSDEPRLWTPKGWHAFEDGAAMAAACADRVAAIVESAIADRGRAVLAFPGGSTPAPAFELLAGRPLDWEKVTILPGDDRIVDQADPLSNFAMLERYFGGTGARLIPLVDDVALGATHAESANRRLADLPWPPDLVWLGVGGDGHTAHAARTAIHQDCFSCLHFRPKHHADMRGDADQGHRRRIFRTHTLRNGM